MHKQSVRDLDVKGKRVFCRVDFNVPMEEGRIADETRIKAALPTIQYLVRRGAKVILASHLGRPKGTVVEALRLTPVAERLAELLGAPVSKTEEVISPEVEKRAAALRDGEVLLLENVRFHPGEEKNDDALARAFAGLGDVFVQDAFGVAHRKHASTSGVAAYLPAVAGMLMEKELTALGRALESPARPFTAVIGGAKVRDKIGVIENLLDKVDHLIIGGGLANTFLKAKGVDVGQSRIEHDKVAFARALITKAEEAGTHLYLPQDVVVAEAIDADVPAQTVDIANIPARAMALDIGPGTQDVYADVINRSALVIWNGPMGVFEVAAFAKGTHAVARAMAAANATTIVGGGDSAAAIRAAGLADKMTHVSTGGGASLEFMEGKALPGVAVLMDKLSSSEEEL